MASPRELIATITAAGMQGKSEATGPAEDRGAADDTSGASSPWRRVVTIGESLPAVGYHNRMPYAAAISTAIDARRAAAEVAACAASLGGPPDLAAVFF